MRSSGKPVTLKTSSRSRTTATRMQSASAMNARATHNLVIVRLLGCCRSERKWNDISLFVNVLYCIEYMKTNFTFIEFTYEQYLIFIRANTAL